MINLTGTEKQIAWATEIRDFNVKMLKNEIESFEKRNAFPEIVEKLKAAVIEVEEGKSEAKFWIEHQNLANAYIQKLNRK